MAQVFLSYCRRDGVEFATALYEQLTRHGVDCWMDVAHVAAGATWGRDIERAIDGCGTLIAILTREAFASDLCRAEQLRALRNNKRIIPLLAHADADRPVHLEHLNYRDASGVTIYSTLAEELVRDIGHAPLVPMPAKYEHTYLTVPPVPAQFMPRPQQVESLRNTLVTDAPRTDTGAMVIWGMGGVGKTVLAQALCRDAVIQAAFPDGVIWTSIGNAPGDPVIQIEEVLKALGEGGGSFDNLIAATNRLRTVMRNKACLLVLDDVWDVRRIEPFRLEAPRTQLLITTRDGGLATSLGARHHRVEALTHLDALALLARWAGSPVEQLPPECDALADECGGLPFALALCGAMHQNGVPWTDLLTSVRAADVAYLENQFPGFVYPSVVKCLHASVEALQAVNPQAVARYLALAVFKTDAPISEDAIVTFWASEIGFEPREARKLLAQLDRRTLLTLQGEPSRRRVSLHDLQVDYVRASIGDLRPLHQRLCRAYHAACGGDWSKGPDDGYFFDHLSHHLREGGASDQLYSLVARPWMQRQFVRSDSHRAFLADLAHVIEVAASERDVFQLVRAVLLFSRLSAGSPNWPEALSALVHLGQGDRAMERAAVIQDPEARGRAYKAIAEAHVMRGNPAAAGPIIEKGLAATTTIVAPDARLLMLSDLADVMLQAGSVDMARRLARDAAIQGRLCPEGGDKKSFLSEYPRPTVLMRAAEVLHRAQCDEWEAAVNDAAMATKVSADAAGIVAIHIRCVALLRRAGYPSVAHHIVSMLELMEKGAAADNWLGLGTRALLFEAMIEAGEIDWFDQWLERLTHPDDAAERQVHLAKAAAAAWPHDPTRAERLMGRALESLRRPAASTALSSWTLRDARPAVKAITNSLARMGRIDEALQVASEQSSTPMLRTSALAGLVAELAAAHRDEGEALAVTEALLQDPEVDSPFSANPEVGARLIQPLVDTGRVTEARLAADRLWPVGSRPIHHPSFWNWTAALCAGFTTLGEEERALLLCSEEEETRFRVEGLRAIARSLLRRRDAGRASWVAKMAAMHADGIADERSKELAIRDVASLLLESGERELALVLSRRWVSWVKSATVDCDELLAEFTRVFASTGQWADARSTLDVLAAEGRAISGYFTAKALLAVVEALVASGDVAQATDLATQLRRTAERVADLEKSARSGIDVAALVDAAQGLRLVGRHEEMTEVARRAFDIVVAKVGASTRYYEIDSLRELGGVASAFAHGEVRDAATHMLKIAEFLNTDINLTEWITGEAALADDHRHRSKLLSSVAAAFMAAGQMEVAFDLFVKALYEARVGTLDQIVRVIQDALSDTPSAAHAEFLSRLAIAMLDAETWWHDNQYARPASS